ARRFRTRFVRSAWGSDSAKTVASAPHFRGMSPNGSPAHNAAMNHTFLFEPGVWVGTGAFWTADAQELAADGRTEITHRDDCWLIAGSLHVLCSPPVTFVNNYVVEPPERDPTTLKWSAETSAIGKFHGTFSVVGPAILSLYA